MTIQEQHNYFNIIQDKFNSPYFVDSEVDIFINRAQEQFINNIIFRDILGNTTTPKGPQALFGIEDSILSNEILNTIMIPDKSVDTDSGGIKALYTAIDTSLMHILSVIAASSNAGAITNSKHLKFIRHNDVGRFDDNTFKKGSTSKPYYKVGSDGIYLYPITGSLENLLVSYIKKPTDVDIAGTNCILPDYTHERIVALALVLGGVATESEILTAMTKI